MNVSDWLESSYLDRVAARVAGLYHLAPQDTPDLLQELRLALWKAGPYTPVNLTWIFHTAHHKAIDISRRRSRRCEVDLDAALLADGSVSADPALYRLLRSRATRLPGLLRQFYALRYEQALSQREIAKQLGLCRGSVRCLDRRCLRLMTGRLAATTPSPARGAAR